MDCTACRLGQLTVPCHHQIHDSAIDCTLCGGSGKRLHRHNIVWGEGPIPADIMLVGEAPGHYEDLQGKPFRPNAPAGRVLHQALAKLGLEGEVYLTNLVRCRPVQNKLRDFPDAIEACQGWLLKEIAWVKPKVIVTLGALAGQGVFPGMRAGEQAETMRCIGNVVCVGAYHPAYVARGSDPTAWPSLLRSLRLARELVKEVR